MSPRRVLPALFLIGFLLASASYADAACMSCISHTGSSYTELACEGDSRYQVIRKCGPFDYTEQNEEITSGGTVRGKNRSSFGTVTEQVDTAYYNCGQGRFVKVLVFRNGILVSITDGDRGSGPQKCW